MSDEKWIVSGQRSSGWQAARPGKRVFTKSLARENRTLGSVRGLSGSNWQSYRNQLFLDANDGNAQFLQQLAL